jgi:hypothetical protein
MMEKESVSVLFILYLFNECRTHSIRYELILSNLIGPCDKFLIKIH